MRIIGFVLGLIWVGIGFIPAHAADVSFRAVWVGPTTYVDGTPGEADDYKLYVCDQPITSVYPDTTPSGTCEGNIQTYVTTEVDFSGIYVSEEFSGILYARVSARKHVLVGDKTVIAESDLSNEVSKVFPLPETPITVLSPPTVIDIETSGPLRIIIK